MPLYRAKFLPEQPQKKLIICKCVLYIKMICFILTKEWFKHKPRFLRNVISIYMFLFLQVTVTRDGNFMYYVITSVNITLQKRKVFMIICLPFNFLFKLPQRKRINRKCVFFRHLKSALVKG